MALIVNSNLYSLNAQRNLNRTQGDLQTSLQRLSSGLRINSAKDDAAGLFTVEKMNADIRGINQAVRNAADGISLGQTAEGALGQLSANMQRVREIAVQSANATVEDRTGLQKEVDQLTQEISRITATSEFNGKTLLTGTASLNFQIGQDGNANQQVTVTTVELSALNSVDTANLTATVTIDVSSASAASAALVQLDSDLDAVAQERATFGAVQNRFESVIANLQNYAENLTASRSRIEDTDFAMETSKLTRAQILQQAGVSILAQANQVPQQALSLLQ
ncbi:MAG TPA: flagellin FliC [Chromatiaceae bacterium]|nr:flagellin FliC [Chromatiaceae bacterium]